MIEHHNFFNSNLLGLKGEEYFANNFLFNNIKPKRVIFELEPELQRKGIDLIAGNLKIDIKTRDSLVYAKYKDILLEKLSVAENNTLGWTYTTESDIVIYGWFNSEEKFFLDGYILYMSIIKDWFKNYLLNNKYKEIPSINKNYTTICVPFNQSQFPLGSIKQMNKFDLFKAQKEKINLII